MTPQIYNELLQRNTTHSMTIVESSEEYEYYNLSDFPLVSEMVLQKYSKAKYISIEPRTGPENNDVVFNLMFFGDDEEVVGGCEITKTVMYWDDDDDEDDDNDDNDYIAT
jgi:hypothetical protein